MKFRDVPMMLLLALAIATGARAQDEALAGTWAGAPPVFAGKRIELLFEKAGGWTSSIAFPDNPAVTADGAMPRRQLEDVEVNLPAVRFAMAAQPARMLFDGRLEGDRLVGSISIEGMGSIGTFELERQ